MYSDSTAILHLLSHLYAQRASSLWKPSSRASWFSKTVSETYASLSRALPAPPRPFASRYDTPALSASVYRHALVNEATCRSLFPFLPRSVLDARQIACDPLPPPTSTTEYNSTFFRGVEDALAPPRARSRAQELHMLERLLPERALREQLLGFWDAHPAVRQRFPGGVMHFAQWASEVPEDVLEDLFITVDALEQVREGGEMPGGMPGGEMMVNFVDPDDVEDEPPAPVAPQPAPPRAIVEEAEEDDEEEEEEEVAVSGKFYANVSVL